MLLYLISFLGGVLTIIAPCVLPVLPVILGGSLSDSSKSIKRPLIITLSLAISITVFTLLLKATTAFISVPPTVWKAFSGSIILIFGLSLLFPNVWSKVAHVLHLEQGSQQALHTASKNKSIVGLVLLGMSLGPVFASCSPTYSIILAVVLPISIVQAIINIAIYAIGLANMLFLIAIFGRALVQKLGLIAKPDSVFKKVLGTILIIVGIAVLTGFDKYIETKLIDAGYTGTLQFEQTLIENVREQIQ